MEGSLRVGALALVVGFLASPAFADEPYVSLNAEILDLIPPAPITGSLQQKRDISSTLNAQRDRGTAALERAQEDSNVDVFRFADVLGPAFNAQRLPLTAKLFAELRKEQSAFTSAAKDCYKRVRPFLADRRIEPPADLMAGTLNKPSPLVPLPPGSRIQCAPAPAGTPQYSYSYPSGHSTFGALAAIELSAMVPERRAALYARGWEYGWSRVVAGVHFPSDVEAGRITAELMAESLAQNPRFQTDFAAAKAEVRAALGLAP
jgi:acid phosphatase (class A)